MNKKLAIKIVIFALFLIGIILVGNAVVNQWRRMTTMDSMELIFGTMCQTLSANNYKQINVAQESLKFYPNIPVRNNFVVDGWKRPLKISIEKTEDGFSIDMRSSGPDGIVGTSDDIIWQRKVLGDNTNSPDSQIEPLKSSQ